MAANDTDLTAPLPTKEDFYNEIERARKRQPHNIELIADYIMAAIEDYQKFGDSEEGFFKATLVETTIAGMPYIQNFMEQCEREHANILAVYTAANSRANEQVSRFKFWQGTAFALAVMTVVYCFFRVFIALGGQWDHLKMWIDKPL